jgi:2-polyprenyl-6-methoxyphenol hydroxylase-like FAD-dependent oxidoreductase
MLSASRPLIESVLRRRTLAAGNVLLWSNCRVTEFLSTGADAAAVQGVRFYTRGGPTSTLSADLVIDASGRGSLALDFLRALGWEEPPTTHVGVDITYSTAIVTIPAHLALNWKVVLTLPDPPDQPLNAVLLPAESNRWMISMADRGTTGRIDSWDAFLAALDRLTTTTLRDALQHAQPPAAIRHYRFPASIWKHFERLPRLPRGLIPIGGAICRFNPIYGQGMSAAVQQSRLLQTALAGAAYQSDPLSAVQAAFMSNIEPILQTPWTMALNSDLAFPQTQATRPDHFERSQGAQAALLRTIVDDPIVHRAFVEVSHLLQPYSLPRTPPSENGSKPRPPPSNSPPSKFTPAARPNAFKCPVLLAGTGHCDRDVSALPNERSTESDKGVVVIRNRRIHDARHRYPQPVVSRQIVANVFGDGLIVSSSV